MAATGPFPHHVNGHLVGLPNNQSFGNGNVVGYTMAGNGMPMGGMNGNGAMGASVPFGGYATATTPAPGVPNTMTYVQQPTPAQAAAVMAAMQASTQQQSNINGMTTSSSSATSTPYSGAPSSATGMLTGASTGVPMSAPIRAPQTGSENKREGVSSFLVCGTRFDVILDILAVAIVNI
jgi:hypothetical protein